MPSVTPLTQDQTFAADSPSAIDRVDAAELDSQIQTIKSRFNDLLAALAVSTRDDNTLTDALVRLRNMHPEVSALIGSKEGWQPKADVQAASTANINLSAPGAALDGRAMVANDRFLAKNQTISSQNGIYIWNGAATPATRSTDADTSTELGYAFVTVAVSSGSGQAGTSWVCNQSAANITLGTTSISFGQIGGNLASQVMVPVITSPSIPLARIALGFASALDPVLTAASIEECRNGLGNVAAVVDSIAQLRGLSKPITATTYFVRGYYVPGDGGGGFFRWNSADSTADNYGTIIQSNAGGAGRWNRIVDEGPGFCNVRWWGAKGDGSTNDTVAIQSAVAALPTGEKTGCLYFPAGHYAISSAIVISGKGCSISGEGRTTSVLRPTVDGPYWVLDCDALNISGNSFDISDIGIREVGLMNSVSAVRVKNCFGPRLRNVNIDIGGKCVWVENCQDINLSDIVATSLAGDTVLRLKAVMGCVTNFNGHMATNTPWGSGSRDEKGPCIWVSGLTVSLFVSNSHFQGGGSREKFAITSISSTVSNFTVTLPSAHTLVPGERLFIDGCSVAAYNGSWKIQSVTSTTVTVLSTANPGAASNGTAGRLRCCLYMDAADGPVNETVWTGVMFEGWYTAREVGSVSVYMDGNNAPTTNGLLNHTFAGCYFDYGQTAMHLHGKIIASDYTVRGVTVSGGIVQFAHKGFYITGSQHTLITGVSTTCIYSRATTSDQADVSAFHIDAAGTGLFAPKRIRIGDCDAGPAVFNDTSFDQRYGIWLAGSGWDELYCVGTHFFGATSAVRLTDGASMAAKTVTIESCTVGDGATMTTADIVPSVASAATITLPWTPTVILTGTTTIDTINGGWPGRVCTLVIPAGLTISAAGNVINGGGAISANSIRVAHFDGTSWRIR